MTDPDDEYGKLDAAGTRMYISPDCLYESTVQEIMPMENISVGVNGSSPMSIDRHPGGYVMYMRLSKSSLDDPATTGYPSIYAAPTIVTVTRHDLQEMKIDIEVPRFHQSADWPGMSQLEDCPCCRKKTKTDGKTEYVYTLQSAMMMGYRGMATKFLSRLFCIPCFTRLSGTITLATASGCPCEAPCIDVVRKGMGQPFSGVDEPPGNAVVGLYLRASTMVSSGFHATLSKDYWRSFANLMGSNSHIGSTENLSPGESPHGYSKLKSKVFERCANCDKSTFDTDEHKKNRERLSGDYKTKPLMTCARCKSVRYCSKECQVADYPRHKPECKKLRAQKDECEQGR